MPVPEYSANGQRYSLLEYILRQTEQLHGRIRRFTSPDEHAFYPDDVPNLVLPPLKYPEVQALHSCSPYPSQPHPNVQAKFIDTAIGPSHLSGSSASPGTSKLLWFLVTGLGDLGK